MSFPKNKKAKFSKIEYDLNNNIVELESQISVMNLNIKSRKATIKNDISSFISKLDDLELEMKNIIAEIKNFKINVKKQNNKLEEINNNVEFIKNNLISHNLINLNPEKIPPQKQKIDYYYTYIN